MTTDNSTTALETGYDLWLRYKPISNQEQLKNYRLKAGKIIVENNTTSATLSLAREELERGLKGLLAKTIPSGNNTDRDGSIIAGTPESSGLIAAMGMDALLNDGGPEGYCIKSQTINGYQCIIIASAGETGVFYGVFHFLKLLQTGNSLDNLDITEKPRIGRRLLNHWETIRCYAGGNIWDWESLPERVDPKYKDYARANASIGINGTSVNLNNADVRFMTTPYLKKVKVLADLFRPYGLKVYLSPNLAAPQLIGGLDTADPLDEKVKKWWKDKFDEIYALIPDFGGFQVKANSEGEAGPQDYGRTHLDGANCLAEAIKPHGGIIFWRAFVYNAEVDPDRLKRAYKEFKPHDGKFKSNVMVQIKNGPLDYQPREPFHPLFGQMPETPLVLEFQITKEYLGHEKHLVYLAPMWKEVLDADTYADGSGSTVAKVIDGSVHGYQETCIAAVANTGGAVNWTGHHFDQANWYAFGRLAWNYDLSSKEIADEWVRMTWSNDEDVVNKITDMMMGSHEACVNYMTPCGLGHIMKADHHYGPNPGENIFENEDWNPVYFNRADSYGLGYDRSSGGSQFTAQYHKPVGDVFDIPETCPDEMLLWFHHVSWNHKMHSGRTLWEELCYRYYDGVRYVEQMQSGWDSLEGKIDGQRFKEVQDIFHVNVKDAAEWRDVCLDYFGGFSGQAVPKNYT